MRVAVLAWAAVRRCRCRRRPQSDCECGDRQSQRYDLAAFAHPLHPPPRFAAERQASHSTNLVSIVTRGRKAVCGHGCVTCRPPRPSGQITYRWHGERVALGAELVQEFRRVLAVGEEEGHVPSGGRVALGVDSSEAIVARARVRPKARTFECPCAPKPGRAIFRRPCGLAVRAELIWRVESRSPPSC